MSLLSRLIAMVGWLLALFVLLILLMQIFEKADGVGVRRCLFKPLGSLAEGWIDAFRQLHGVQLSPGLRAGGRQREKLVYVSLETLIVEVL